MIEYLDVTRIYPNQPHPAVDHLSLTVGAGKICVLLGPSGCGKTTLMRMTNRLIEPTSGSIRVAGVETAGKDPVELRRGIGYVIQGVGLFPHRTVAGNVAIPLELIGRPKAEIARRVDELLEMMRLDPARYRHRYPAELSGGEQQRVGVARALAADPPVLLMDEPFGAIDPVNRAEIQQEFLELQRRLHKSIIFVSHDVREAILLGDTIALMHKGRLLQHGPAVELLARPADPFVASFFGDDGERLLLDAIHIGDIALDSNPLPSDRSLRPGDSLHTALVALLSAGSDSLPVASDDGALLGAITMDAIRSALLKQRIGAGTDE
jgi:osmoprotectant transport system ATP-binding protein